MLSWYSHTMLCPLTIHVADGLAHSSLKNATKKTPDFQLNSVTYRKKNNKINYFEILFCNTSESTMKTNLGTSCALHYCRWIDIGMCRSHLQAKTVKFCVNEKSIKHTLHWWIQAGMPPLAPPPAMGPILSFLHTFLPKSAHNGHQCPRQRG